MRRLLSLSLLVVVVGSRWLIVAYARAVEPGPRADGAEARVEERSNVDVEANARRETVVYGR
jgi:hypothetical protein